MEWGTYRGLRLPELEVVVIVIRGTPVVHQLLHGPFLSVWAREDGLTGLLRRLHLIQGRTADLGSQRNG